MKLEIQSGTDADVASVAGRLRAEDKLELETASGLSSTEALYNACIYSQLFWSLSINGSPEVIFGVCVEPVSRGGVIWLVGTDAISRNAKAVFKLSKVVLGHLLSLYPYLHNQADCRNELHLRWLRLLGFSMGPIVQVNGHPFQRFFIVAQPKEAPCVNQQQSLQELV